MEEGDSRALALAIQDVLHASRPESVEDAETEALCRALAGLKRAGCPWMFWPGARLCSGCHHCGGLRSIIVLVGI